MTRFTEHPQIYDQPICLPKEQISDPMLTIRDFLATYRLSELRKIQDDIQRVCLTTEDPAFKDATDRAKLLRYNDKLICLLEAAVQLQGTFPTSGKAAKQSEATPAPTPVKSNPRQIAQMITEIKEISIDLANLSLIVIDAWHARALAVLDDTEAKPGKRPSAPPPMDMDKLYSITTSLQHKLAKLTAVAVDIFIAQLDLPRKLTAPSLSEPAAKASP